MTAQQQILAASSFADLWRGLMPGQDVPPQSTFLTWAGIYTDHLVSRGVTRAASKSRKTIAEGGSMSGEDCTRYASSVMKHELESQRHQAQA
jgi:hypothetical protein